MKYPDDAPYGIATEILVLLQLCTARVVPFSETVLLLCVAPKFVPWMATTSPKLAVLGDKPVIVKLRVPGVAAPTE
jgi:hypothetical protein